METDWRELPDKDLPEWLLKIKQRAAAIPLEKPMSEKELDKVRQAVWMPGPWWDATERRALRHFFRELDERNSTNTKT